LQDFDLFLKPSVNINSSQITSYSKSTLHKNNSKINNSHGNFNSIINSNSKINSQTNIKTISQANKANNNLNNVKTTKANKANKPSLSNQSHNTAKSLFLENNSKITMAREEDSELNKLNLKVLNVINNVLLHLLINIV